MSFPGDYVSVIPVTGMCGQACACAPFRPFWGCALHACVFQTRFGVFLSHEWSGRRCPTPPAPAGP